MSKSSKKSLKKIIRSPLGLLGLTLISGSLAYGFISLSIDRGNLFYYAAAIASLAYGLKTFFRLLGKFIHERQAS